MILEMLVGVGATMLAASNSKEANRNISIANNLNADTYKTIQPAIDELNACGNILSYTLRRTSDLREMFLLRYADSFVYYLQHMADVEKKEEMKNEIEKLGEYINNYRTNIDNLLSLNLDQNTMLVSAAAGGLVTGASIAGLSATGVSTSIGLGLSFFGIGSFLMSSIQLSKSQDVLQEAQYLNANKHTLYNEIKYKSNIIYKINKIFNDYDEMLSKFIDQFKDDLFETQEIYRECILSSKKNIRLIIRGKQPVISFNRLDDEKQKRIYLATQKCRLFAEFARSKILDLNGNIDYNELKKIGLSYE